ncbi:hypothetical protein M5K25_015558 [Dendrobium thyrsiflorum]|uniref:Uncharacterized protein n=1 Tax=Dendrobium thyrsiflorum TaxID=117978 RepID=A0ABD0URE8_DENTH
MVLNSPDRIYASSVNYFVNIFNKDFIPQLDIDKSLIPHLIDENDNTILIAVFSSSSSTNSNNLVVYKLTTTKVALLHVSPFVLNILIKFMINLVFLIYLCRSLIWIPLSTKVRGNLIFLMGSSWLCKKKKHNTWAFNFLSFDGRLVLIKTKNGKSAILWASWKKYCGGFKEGGLGCKNLSDMTKAFSYKLWFSFRSCKKIL